MKLTTLLFTFTLTILISSCDQKTQEKETSSKFYTDTIFSEFLSENRVHNVYLPKNHNRNEKYKIIYATDGQDLEKKNFIKKTLDSLIDNKIIKPIIYIGSYSNNLIADSTSTSYTNGEKMYLTYRLYDYTMTSHKNDTLNNRLNNHMNYFKNELIPNIETELTSKIDNKERYFFGVSNGAAFGIYLLNKYPELIGNYILYSTAGVFNPDIEWKSTIKYPFLYLEYGNEEPFLHDQTRYIKTEYDNLNLPYFFKEYNGGHDREIWNKELTNQITSLFSVEK